MDEGKALKENILWLIQNGHIEMARNCILEAKDLLVVTDWLALKSELQIRQQLFQQARETLTLGLAQEPCHLELLEMSLFLAGEIEKDEKESRRVGALLSMLTGISVINGTGHALELQNSRVLHGTMEIANQMNTLVTSLQKRGLHARSINYYQSYLNYNSEQDISFSDCSSQEEANLKAKRFAADIISDYDIFHFYFGTSLTFDHSDVPLITSLGKKLVMHYLGSDVRRFSIARQYNPYVTVKNQDELQIVNDIKNIALHIQDCIVGDQELYLYVKDYFPRVHILQQAINLEHYFLTPTEPKPRPLIVHAPTSPEFKGTKFILQAIDILRQEYDFDFKLIQGMSHEEAKATYQQADLIIDQILAGSHGLLAVEAMAMGKPVICWISEYMEDKYPKDLPLISANPDTITNVLRNVLCNQDMLPDLGLRGRLYVEKYHDANIMADKLVAIYKGL